MLTILGQAAFTAPQLARLSQKISRLVPSIADIQAQWVYFIDAPVSLTPDRDRLALLLMGEESAPARPEAPPKSSPVEFWVIPRVGTLSPWASKATQILQLSGWPDIQRVERGCVFTLFTMQPLTDQDQQTLGELLHDRMTQSLLAQAPTAETMFGHHAVRNSEFFSDARSTVNGRQRSFIKSEQAKRLGAQ